MQRKVRILAVVVLVVGASAATYFAGLSVGRAEADFHRFDTLVSELGNQIFIHDALAIRQPDKALVVLTASMESNFNALVEIYENRRFQDFHDLRCAITQRIRNFRAAGLVIGDDKGLTKSGYDAKRLTEYLAGECPGEPKKANWAEDKRAFQPVQEPQ